MFLLPEQNVCLLLTVYITIPILLIVLYELYKNKSFIRPKIAIDT